MNRKKNGHGKPANGHDLRPALIFLDLKPEQLVSRDEVMNEVGGWHTAFETYKAAGEAMKLSPGHISRIARGLANAGPKVLDRLGMGRQWQYYRNGKQGGG